VKILTSSKTMATKMGIELHLQLHGKTLIKKTNFLPAKVKEWWEKVQIQVKVAEIVNVKCI